MEVLVNHVGYDLYGSKIAVLQSEDDLDGDVIFQVIEKRSRKRIHEGIAKYFGKVYPETMNDWGFWYWTLDFSDFNKSGEFFLKVEIKDKKAESYPFEIGKQLLWRKTITAAFDYLAAFHYTEPNDGVLEDDLKHYDVTGGWNVGYNKAKHLRDLGKSLQAMVSVYEQRPESFSKAQQEELTFGAVWFKKAMIHYPKNGRMIGNVGGWSGKEILESTDGIKGRKLTWYDEPYHVGGHYKLICIQLLAKLEFLFPGQGYLSHAKKMWEYYENGIWSDKIFDFPIVKKAYPNMEVNFIDNVFLDDDALLLLGDVELYEITKDPKYLEHAEQVVDALIGVIKTKKDYWVKWSMAQWYDSVIPAALATFALKCKDSSKTAKAKKHVVEFMDKITEDALETSPFALSRYCREWLPFTPSHSIPGITFFADGKAPDWVNNEGKGLNPYYAWRAHEALLVQDLLNDDEKKRYDMFARAQINWILGCNPLNVSMMANIGKKNPVMSPGLQKGGICHGVFSKMHTDQPSMALGNDPAIGEGHQKWAGQEIITRGTAYYLMAISLLP